MDILEKRRRIRLGEAHKNLSSAIKWFNRANNWLALAKRSEFTPIKLAAMRAYRGDLQIAENDLTAACNGFTKYL